MSSVYTAPHYRPLELSSWYCLHFISNYLPLSSSPAIMGQVSHTVSWQCLLFLFVCHRILCHTQSHFCSSQESWEQKNNTTIKTKRNTSFLLFQELLADKEKRPLFRSEWVITDLTLFLFICFLSGVCLSLQLCTSLLDFSRFTDLFAALLGSVMNKQKLWNMK